MTWMNVPFPPRLAFGIECDPEWETTVVTTIGGQESRKIQWADARHSYDASFVIRTLDDHQEIREHFHMARGRLHSWPLTDPSDHICKVSAGIVVARVTANTYQLHKRYGSGSFAYDRKITRPFVASIYKSGVLQTSGYTLDADTGVLTISGTNATELTWAGQFYVPCRYDVSKLPVRIENKQGQGQFLVVSDSLSIVEVKE